jgi:triosephosphate isomerase
LKPTIRTPYFEIGTKNYVYGDKVLEYALAADAAAEKYDIDVLSSCRRWRSGASPKTPGA